MRGPVLASCSWRNEGAYQFIRSRGQGIHMSDEESAAPIVRACKKALPVEPAFGAELGAAAGGGGAAGIFGGGGGGGGLRGAGWPLLDATGKGACGCVPAEGAWCPGGTEGGGTDGGGGGGAAGG
jgi:hypothetical protein